VIAETEFEVWVMFSIVNSDFEVWFMFSKANSDCHCGVAVVQWDHSTCFNAKESCRLRVIAAAAV
jgi:hypothetical protein